MHRTLSILIIFLIASASLLLMFGSNIFSNAMAIEEVDWYGLDRYIKYAMDIANSPHEDDDYDPLLLEREYTNSYEEEEEKEQYTDYNTYDNYDNKYSKHSTKDNRFVCKEGQFTGFFVTNLKFCDINIVGPQGPQGPQGIQGAPGSVNVTNAYVVWRDNTSGNYDIFFRASQTSDTINLSNNTGTSISPQITSEGNHVYVVWWEDSTTTTGNPDIFFSKSNDNGLTFSTPVNLSNNAGGSSTPQISTEGNNVYVVWEDRTTSNANADIFFSKSNDNGLTFSTPVNLSNNARTSSSPQISTEGNHVYVVWQDNTPGIETDIFFTHSNDNGLTFSTPVNLSNNIPESNEPQISTEGDNVYVVWYDDDTPNNEPDIFFAHSNDNGLTFSTPVNLSNNTGHSEAPLIASEGNNVYVVWEDRTTSNNADIFFSKSNDNGLIFSTPVNLSNNIGTSQEPEISAEGNNVYVVWFDNTPGNYDIIFSRSNDNGLTFSTPVNLSNTIGESNEPQISTEGDNVYVVWQDRTPGNPDIFYITNNLDFGTFGNIINISNNAGESFIPQISSSTS